MDLVIGTAGHIDHGKTSLIKALTGKDADRLPEEKARGITIDLGFAELNLEGMRIGFVDVPGHEKFIHNMIAGATGIDVVMLVVAADEGVMPQTREHFQICSLLKIRTGLVVLTKTDLVNEEWISAVEEEVDHLVKGSFLEGARKVRVSSRTGDGIQILISELEGFGKSAEQKVSDDVVRLPIDRSFAVKGFGTVITGTLSGGSFAVGDEMILLPSKRKVRVRGIQIHGTAVEKTSSSQRTAVNLSGIDSKEISRGEVLAEDKSNIGSQIVDALVEVIPSAKDGLKSRQRVRIHHGSSEILARVHLINDDSLLLPGKSYWVQLRLESPLIAIPGDRFVIRRYSPQETIGGGEVVRVDAPKFRRKKKLSAVEFLEKFRASDDEGKILLLADEYGPSGVSIDLIQSRVGCGKASAENLMSRLLESNKLFGSETFAVSSEVLSSKSGLIKKFIEATVSKDAASDGVSMSVIRNKFPMFPERFISLAINHLLLREEVGVSGELVSPRDHSATLPDNEKQLAEEILSVLNERRFEAPKKSELIDILSVDEEVLNKVIDFLTRKNSVTMVSNEFVFSSSSLDEIKRLVWDFADSTADRVIDVSIFKSITGLSRKYAIPILEYLDNLKVTVRAGDKRVALKRPL